MFVLVSDFLVNPSSLRGFRLHFVFWRAKVDRRRRRHRRRPLMALNGGVVGLLEFNNDNEKMDFRIRNMSFRDRVVRKGGRPWRFVDRIGDCCCGTAAVGNWVSWGGCGESCGRGPLSFFLNSILIL